MSDITPFPDKKKSFLFTKTLFLKNTNRRKRSRKALTKEKNITTRKDHHEKMRERKKYNCIYKNKNKNTACLKQKHSQKGRFPFI
jgi:hypothetical protein